MPRAGLAPHGSRRLPTTKMVPMAKTPPNHELLTTEEAAAYLRVSQYTVWRWCTEGRLPAFQIGREWRISKTRLDEKIEELEASNGGAGNSGNDVKNGNREAG